MPEGTPTTGFELTDSAGDVSARTALWSYLGILRRRIWIVLSILVITTTLGMIKAVRTPRIYRASARLLVEQQAPSVMQFNAGDSEGRWDPDFYRTQAELASSRAVLEVALESPAIGGLFAAGKEAEERRRLSSFAGEIKRTVLAALGVTPPAPPQPWELLRDQVRAENLTDTHFLSISSQHTDPYRATLIANEVARAFKTYHQRHTKELLGEAFGMLEKEKEKEELALLESEEELQKYREQAQSVTVTATPKDQPAIERLVKLNQELTDVQLERIELSAQIGVMREALGGDPHVGQALDERLFSIPVIQTDPELSRTRQNLAESEKQLSVLIETYGPNHPVLLSAQTNIVLLRSQFRNSLEEILSSHDNRLQMLRNEETELQNRYEDQRKVTLTLAKEEFELTRLQNKVDRHRRLFDALVERMREVDVTSGLSRTNVQITQEATLPKVPINAGKLQTILFAIFLGLFLGIGLAFLFENLDDTIKTPEDLKERGDLPLLGFVPSITKDKPAPEKPAATAAPATLKERAATLGRTIFKELRGQTRIALKEVIPALDREEPEASSEDRLHRGSIVLAEPASSIAEAYRSIRASLFYSSPAEELKVLSITSCRPKEGKTTTSTNLAISMAQTGKRVLLIDGDLHRPSVHRNLGLSDSRGLTSVLVGEWGWRESLQKISRDGQSVDTLDVLGAGPTSPNPSELLGSTRMQTLLKEVRQEYDWVIVDTPPVLFVTDASILSVLCDAVVVVVRAGYSTNTLLARTTEKLRDVRANIVGGILNNVVVSRIGRYYSTYYNVGYSRYARDYHRSYYANDAAAEDRRRQEDAASSASAAAAAAAPEDPAAEAARRLREQRARSAQLETERARLQAGMVALEQQAAAARAELATAQAALEDERRLRASAPASSTGPATAELDALRRELAGLRTTLATREREQADARSRDEAQQQITAAREREHASLLDRLHRELDALRSDHARLQQELQTARAHSQEAIPPLQARIHILEQQAAAATQELDAARRDAANARRELDAARHEVTSAAAGGQRGLEEARLRIESLSQDLAAERARRLQIESARQMAVQEAEQLTERLGREIRARAEAQARAEAAEQSRLELLTRQAAAPTPMPAPAPAPAPTPAPAPAPEPAPAATPAPPPPQQPQVQIPRTHPAPTPVFNAQPQPPAPELDLSRSRNMRAALEQADLHIAAGDIAHARPLLERIVAAKADQWDAWERLLPLLARTNDRAALEQHAQRFSGMKGRGHYIYALCWGYRANLQGDQQGAGVYFEQALKDDARSIPALEALVRLALSRRDMDGAHRLVERLMRADANNAYAHYARASLDYVAGRQAQAEAAMRRSLQLGRTPEALSDLALMLQAGGNLAEAESLARTAVSLDDQFHQGWDTLATILLRAGHRQEARAAYERALALSANNDHARVELADLYAHDGNRDRATELTKSLLSRADTLAPELRLRLATVREGLGL